MTPASLLTTLGIALAASVVFVGGKICYNLFFHPLAKVPGPRWAAVTRLWLFFQEMTGMSHEHLLDLHNQKYGPVIRIAPNELSINDVDAYRKAIYSQNTKFPKADYFYHAFHNPTGSVFSETNSKIHSQEKRLMSHAFSRANIMGLQDSIYDTVHQWIAQIRSFVDQNKPIPLWYATQCLTLETASRFTYGSSDGAMDTKDFKHPLLEAMDQFGPAIVAMHQFPFVQTLLGMIQRLNPSGIGDLNKGAEGGLARLKYRKATGERDGMVMFDSMVERAQAHNWPLDDGRIVGNGIVMLVAGTGTTAASLTTAIYHSVAQPKLWKELQDALLSAFGSNPRPDLTELEKIPLLEACVKEALRLGCPARGRHPRAVPAGGWKYQGHYIPEKTIVGAAPVYHCYDPVIFPEPRKFMAERWLKEDTKEMQNYLLPFSYGTRSCIGQNLALMELKLGLSQVIMNFDPGQIMDKGLSFVEYGGLTRPEGGLVTLKPVNSGRTFE